MRLGEFIKSYREEHKISMRSFAKMTDLSTTYISYLERGETQRGTPPVPSIETYKAVAQAVGITTDDLVRIVDDDVCINSKKTPIGTDERITPEIRELMDICGDDPTLLKELLDYAKFKKANR